VTRLLVACALGTVAVDVDEEEEAELVDDEVVTDAAEVDLPLVVAAAAHGSTVVAVVDRRPPRGV
jgi:pseudouridine-5'-phosphate glycosidase